MHAMTATLVRRDEHRPALVAGSQGNMQALAGGDWMVGWGESPWLTEYGPGGQLLFDAHLPPSWESYRVYRQAWSAPARWCRRPSRSRARARAATVYASWNGATEVASWRVLAGTSAQTLAPRRRRAAARLRDGDRAARRRRPARFVQVQALDATGAVLGASAVPKG